MCGLILNSSKLFVLVVGFCFSLEIQGQDNDALIRLEVLEKAEIGKEFVFGKWNSEGDSESHLRYLGSIKTQSGQEFLVLNSIWIWGNSQRATSRILIFNSVKKYVGNYYLDSKFHLPSRIENQILIFNNVDNNSECDTKIQSKIDFNDGIPIQIFRECTPGNGDLYVFDFEKE